MSSEQMPSQHSKMEELREDIKEVKEEAKEAIVDEKALDKHAPGAAFSLVFLSYLLILLLVFGGIGLVYRLFF